MPVVLAVVVRAASRPSPRDVPHDRGAGGDPVTGIEQWALLLVAVAVIVNSVAIILLAVSR